jgi:plastocyanin
MSTNLKLGACLSAAWLIAACGGDGGTGGNANRVLAKTATASGDGQTAAVATTLPLDLRVVLTEDGSPKPNATINWSAVNGSVAPATSVTDGSGIATTTWTLGTMAGTQNARAQYVGAAGSPQIFSATSVPGAPAALTLVGGDFQYATLNAPFAAPLQVKVSDAFGNGTAAVSVNWAVTAGPAAVGAPAATSNSQGISSMPITAGGTPGAVTVEATSAAVPADKVTFALNVVTAIRDVTLGDIFFKSSTNNTQNPAVDTVQVGQVVRWTNTGGGHTVQSQGSPSFPNSGSLSTVGATYTFVFNTPGTYQYNCAIHGNAMTGRIVVQ